MMNLELRSSEIKKMINSGKRSYYNKIEHNED